MIIGLGAPGGIQDRCREMVQGGSEMEQSEGFKQVPYCSTSRSSDRSHLQDAERLRAKVGSFRDREGKLWWGLHRGCHLKAVTRSTDSVFSHLIETSYLEHLHFLAPLTHRKARLEPFSLLITLD
jgi:hypothetical protein